MDSGFKLTDEIRAVFDDIVEFRGVRYAVFKIENGLIVVEKKGDLNKSYADYLTDLTGKEEARYGLFLYNIQLERRNNVVLLMEWIPKSESTYKQLLYSNGFDATMKRLNVDEVIRTSDASNLEQGAVEEILRQNHEAEN